MCLCVWLCQVFWHSSAHILGWAIEQFFSKHVDVELCDGPALDDGNALFVFGLLLCIHI